MNDAQPTSLYEKCIVPGIGGPFGTAFYVNGILAPDIYLERGTPYTFVVETGLGTDPETKTFHPLYVTTDPEGGYQSKTEYERKVEVSKPAIS